MKNSINHYDVLDEVAKVRQDVNTRRIQEAPLETAQYVTGLELALLGLLHHADVDRSSELTTAITNAAYDDLAAETLALYQDKTKKAPGQLAD